VRYLKYTGYFQSGHNAYLVCEIYLPNLGDLGSVDFNFLEAYRHFAE
jgi:hypothetical protein